jgi:uncharacterized membrane protein
MPAAETSSSQRLKSMLRWGLAGLYLIAGVLHLVMPEPFLTITPSWVPYPSLVIAVTGILEILGAAGLLSQRFRNIAGWALAAYAICVFPANITHALQDFASADDGLGWWYHAPRLALQPALVWAAYYCSRSA